MNSAPVQLDLATVERVGSLADAENKVRHAIDKLGLYPSLKEHSLKEHDHNGDGPTTWSCDLIGADSVPLDHGSGAGKGNRAEARTGALFEALEHFLAGSDFLDVDKIALRPAACFTTGALVAEASTAILAATPEHMLASCQYSSLQSDARIDVPLYMSSPWYVEDPPTGLHARLGDDFDYRNAARYSTNSGWAIGVTENEAIVHGLNEVIERDAFSLLITRSFFGRTRPPAVIRLDSLPHILAELYSYVENRLGTSVYLIDMTTDVDVPAFVAYVPPTTEKSHLAGAGASLSPGYAAYRALNELLQVYLLRESKQSTKDPFAHLEPLREYPSLYKCGLFDLTDLIPQARTVAFENRPAPLGPTAHLAELLARIHKAGFSVYQGRTRVLDNGITATHILVPGMEHFMTITQGVLIAPGKRGVRESH